MTVHIEAVSSHADQIGRITTLCGKRIKRELANGKSQVEHRGHPATCRAASISSAIW